MRISFRLKTVIQAAVLAALLFTTQNGVAQGTRSDYERALNLRKTTADKVFKQRVRPHWLEGNTRFWYRNDLAGQARKFVLVDAETGTREPAFDHERLAAALAEATGEEVLTERLAIEKLRFSKSGTELLFTTQGKRWKCDLRSYELREVAKDDQIASSIAPQAEPRPSSRTGEETSITFINRTKGDVEVYWLDFEAERRHYVTIRGGEQHQQHTFAGHVWLVTDKAEKTLA